MITIRTAAPEELPQLRDLWRKCFGDPGAYVDIFFQKFCSIDQVLVVDDDGEVDSMAAMLPGAIQLPDGTEVPVGYVYALATNPYMQGKGHARQLLRYAGEDGVAAYGVLMYVNLIFLAAFLGYSVGTAPVISYHYGAANHKELRGLLRKSLGVIGAFALAMFAAAELLARPLSLVFVSYDPQLLSVTLRGFAIYSFSFLFSGFAIFGSSFFTALNNGLVSALISFLRTLVFQVLAVLTFPLIWKLDGIWVSMVAAEVLAAGVSVVFWVVMRKKYRY